MEITIGGGLEEDVLYNLAICWLAGHNISQQVACIL